MHETDQLAERRQARDLAHLCDELAHNLRVGRVPGWLCGSITPRVRIAHSLVADFLAGRAGARPIRTESAADEVMVELRDALDLREPRPWLRRSTVAVLCVVGAGALGLILEVLWFATR